MVKFYVYHSITCFQRSSNLLWDPYWWIFRFFSIFLCYSSNMYLWDKLLEVKCLHQRVCAKGSYTKLSSKSFNQICLTFTQCVYQHFISIGAFLNFSYFSQSIRQKKWYLTVVLLCIFLIMRIINHLLYFLLCKLSISCWLEKLFKIISAVCALNSKYVFSALPFIFWLVKFYTVQTPWIYISWIYTFFPWKVSNCCIILRKTFANMRILKNIYLFRSSFYCAYSC